MKAITFRVEDDLYSDFRAKMGNDKNMSAVLRGLLKNYVDEDDNSTVTGTLNVDLSHKKRKWYSKIFGGNND